MAGTYWFEDLKVIKSMRSLTARECAQLILDNTFASGLDYCPDWGDNQPSQPSELWQDGELASTEMLFQFFMLDELFDPLDEVIFVEEPTGIERELPTAEELLWFILYFMARSGYERVDEHGESAYVWEPWFDGYNVDNGTVGARLTRAFTEMLRREFLELIPQPTP